MNEQKIFIGKYYLRTDFLSVALGILGTLIMLVSYDFILKQLIIRGLLFFILAVSVFIFGYLRDIECRLEEIKQILLEESKNEK